MTETPRQKWMQMLADADVTDLKAGYAPFADKISYTWLVKPETGMLMVQGRADSTGAPFCLGEMTVTRCMVQAEDDIQGYAMVQGSDHEHVRLAALLDALLQMPDFHAELAPTLLAALKSREQKRQQAMAKDIADTTVEFFTLKRGE
ncbi:MAG: phosphonate C-P lyase system protein PhnG [Desulfotignum sp.]